jgi:hypothetical protein
VLIVAWGRVMFRQFQRFPRRARLVSGIEVPELPHPNAPQPATEPVA